MVQRVVKLNGAGWRVCAVEVVREGFGLPPEYHAGFREEIAGGSNGFCAIAVNVGTAVLVPQMQPDVLRLAVEILRRHVRRYLETLPSLENRSLRPVWNGGEQEKRRSHWSTGRASS
jgi:hypothetical protein